MLPVTLKMSNLHSGIPSGFGSNSSGQPRPLLAETATQAILYLLILIIGLPLNTLVLLLVYKCRALRSITNAFVASLALADFLITLLGLPVIVIATIAQSWPFGGTFCQISGFLTFSLRNVSILSVAGIAVDRYYVIARPFILTVTRDRALKMIVFLWWSGLLGGIPPLFGLGLYKFSPTRCLCDFSWPDGGSSLAYGIYLFIWIYLTSLLILTISYYLIYQVTRDHMKYKAQRLASSLSPGSGDGSIPSELKSFRLLQASLSRKWASFMSSSSTFNLNTSSPSGVAMESKTAKTIVAVITTCLVTWLPYFILNFHCSSLSDSKPPRMLDFLATWLTFVNCALNPVLYALLNRQFRHCLRENMRLWFRLSAQQASGDASRLAGTTHNGGIARSQADVGDGSAPFSTRRDLSRPASRAFPVDSSLFRNPLVRPRSASFQQRTVPTQRHHSHAAL
ncbi:G-protein coupled receptor 161-like [Hemiscyllium ocellatum]|uniref:G-protein coupled receptor 161-like n=1 Tax=Hemiscyllium ocellatum TaxID=170820 RepID=UPI002965FAC0|nr:G-protein coupled receptor 161-like [Hemiscyllium ocellatum]